MVVLQFQVVPCLSQKCSETRYLQVLESRFFSVAFSLLILLGFLINLLLWLEFTSWNTGYHFIGQVYSCKPLGMAIAGWKRIPAWSTSCSHLIIGSNEPSLSRQNQRKHMTASWQTQCQLRQNLTYQSTQKHNQYRARRRSTSTWSTQGKATTSSTAAQAGTSSYSSEGA